MKNKIENQRFSVWKLNRISNKGISPLIATVLIIGFTIVLSALVITWGTGLFKKTVSSTEELSEFNLLCTTGINFEGTAQYKDGGQIIETLLSNRNEKEIYGFHFTVRDKENTFYIPSSKEVGRAFGYSLRKILGKNEFCHSGAGKSADGRTYLGGEVIF